MTQSARKGRLTLEKMEALGEISEHGRQWLKIAMDPFPDEQVEYNGYPDIDTAPSISQCYTKTHNCVAPPGTATNWNCLVLFNPTSPAQSPGLVTEAPLLRSILDTYGNVVSQNALSAMYSGVNAFCTVASDIDNQASVSTLGLPIIQGAHRLIACGYEVVNTTSDLYKQGSVTNFRTPAVEEIAGHLSSDGSNTWKTEKLQGPPSSMEAATLFPSTRTWSAKDGVYMVCTQSGPLKYRYPNSAVQAGVVTKQPGRLADVSGLGWFPYTAPGVSPSTKPACNVTYPYDFCGSYFTGLHPSASLTLTVKYYIERLPTYDEPDLMVLAKRPASFDPIAMEIYARAMAHLPVAVEVGMNPMGEWFKKVLSAVSKFAPTVGAFTGIPGGGAIGQGAATIAKAWLDSEDAPQQQPRKAIQQRPPREKFIGPMPREYYENRPKRKRRRRKGGKSNPRSQFSATSNKAKRRRSA